MRRRIWSETVPFERARAPEVKELLRRFAVAPIVAVRPGGTEGLAELIKDYEAVGLEVAIWPMLDDASGRWASAKNDGEFRAFVRAVIDELDAKGALPHEVAVDLEPPIEDVKNIVALSPIDARRIPLDVDRPRFEEAKKVFSELVRELHDRGVGASAAIVPTVLLDAAATSAWQSALSTPVDGPAWEAVSAMLYTTIFEGWSKGFLQRADARAILAAACGSARERFGERAGVSLGCVAAGALGDEPVYRSANELADDVGIARACGIDDLTLFDLGGVLARTPADPWLEAFTMAPIALEIPPSTWRSKASLAAARVAGGALSALTRWAR